MAQIAVIGAGYVGLTSAAGLAALGHRVVCADIDPDRVNALRRGEIPIRELGMETLVRQGLESGALRFVLGAAEASKESEFHFLCLQTPPRADGAADLQFLLAAVREIAPVLQPRSVLVNKSTVPVGTASVVQAAVDRDDVSVVSNPEFLREGTAIDDFMHPDRVVVGSDDDHATDRVAALYAGMDAPILRTDAKSSELIKYASNAYLATKLTFVNEMAEVCEQVGADIDDVMLGMGQDRRIGTSYLQPGPGWGGSCFPKDTEALVHIAAQVDCEFDFLRSVIALNHRHIERVAAKVEKAVGGGLDNQRVAVWGLTIKAGTDDLRDSPAVAVSRLLIERGAQIVAFDPAVDEPPPQLPEVMVTTDPVEATRGAACLVILTEWDTFTKVDMADVHAAMAAHAIVDARNVLDREHATSLGFTITGVGK
mgnify:FL=1